MQNLFSICPPALSIIALSFDKLISGSADLSGFSLDTAALQPIAYMADGTKQKITLSIRSGGKLGNGFLQQSGNTPLAESNEQKSALDAQVWVSPNPFSQKLLIDLGRAPSGARATVTIFNSIGQQVWQWQGSAGGTLEASTATWPDGVYYYQVKVDESTTSGKVIKGQ
ncbi:MAG: T9SS type A sorting domain-containing protein [Phaeodactylibacter sp.]|uniref:T9SS type A sorting domain-containing protein n=1 Tax=Phaeodactylibacter sp. TaxID=1940289 RepID=UPI0032EFB609